MKLINATRQTSIVGSIVRQVNNTFVLCNGAEKDGIFIVTQSVPHGQSCEVVNTGTAKVLVDGSIKAGDGIRSRLTSDKVSHGYKADSNVPYIRIGTALEDGRNKLIDVALQLQYTTAIHGYGSGWDDLRAPASGINPAGQVSPPTVNSTDGSLTFATSNAVCIWFQLPHSWKEGTSIHPHLHWSKSSSASGTVKWQMKYKWANRGDAFPAFSDLVDGTEEVANANTANKHSVFNFPIIIGTGKTISSMICIYLIRTASGDTYGADANLYEFDIHYEIDSVGSRSEHIKY